MVGPQGREWPSGLELTVSQEMMFELHGRGSSHLGTYTVFSICFFLGREDAVGKCWRTAFLGSPTETFKR